jgi:hypothetical protein
VIFVRFVADFFVMFVRFVADFFVIFVAPSFSFQHHERERRKRELDGPVEAVHRVRIGVNAAAVAEIAAAIHFAVAVKQLAVPPGLGAQG